MKKKNPVFKQFDVWWPHPHTHYEPTKFFFNLRILFKRDISMRGIVKRSSIHLRQTHSTHFGCHVMLSGMLARWLTHFFKVLYIKKHWVSVWGGQVCPTQGQVHLIKLAWRHLGTYHCLIAILSAPVKVAPSSLVGALATVMWAADALGVTLNDPSLPPIQLHRRERRRARPSGITAGN